MTGRTPRLRIGIDGHVLGKNIGGVERYLSEVVKRVPDLLPQHDFVVFVTPEALARRADDLRQNVTFVPLRVSDPLIQRSLVLPWAVRSHRLDVLQVQRIAPWACGSCKLVLTVHDLTPILHPNDYPGFRNRLVRFLTPSSLRRADLVICPSHTVCNAITARYPDLRAPCLPFTNGVDRRHFDRSTDMACRETLRRLGIVRPYIFAPGAIETRKNLEVVLGALSRLEPASRPDLVLCGPVRNKDYFDRIMLRASALGVADNVRYLGFVPEDDLVLLYQEASLCVAASRDEGFNLMPIEALACGTPVLCSDIPVHRELFEDAAQFFPCGDPDVLAGLILRGLRNSAPIDPAGAETCLARLSWDAMARRMADLFDGLATRPGARPVSGASAQRVRPAQAFAKSTMTRLKTRGSK